MSRLLGWVASRAGAPSVLAMAAATAGFASSGCTSSGDAPPTLGTTVNGIDSGGSTNSCATPNTDCPCTDEGQTVACGEVVMRSGDYVSCSEGTRTCVNGAWSVCAGSYVTTQSLTLSTNGIRVQKLNPSLPCGDAGVGNLCDPLCTTFIDDPSGLDAGLDSGLTINEAGITLTGNPIPPAQCKGLAITPNTSPTKDLVITSISSSGTPSPSNVQFSASLTPAGCYPGTPTYLWDIDKYDTAQISSTGLLNIVAPIAGPVTVTGFAGSLTASVVSNVTVNVVDATGAPAGVTNAQFPATTGTADSIKVLYPYPATVFPLGLPSPLIQWSNGGTAATAVKVTLRFPTTGTTLFSWSEIVPESQTAPTPSLPAQPRATIPQAIWNAFQQTVVRNSGSTGGDAIFAIQRYVKGATSTTLYAEVPTTFHFANGQLKGNIFYNSYGTNLVKNFASTAKGAAFGAATLEVAANGTAPTVVVGYNDSTNSGAGCRVCHNVAANGSVILSNSYLSNGSTGSGATEATTFTYNPNLSTPALIQSSESLVGSYGSNVFTFAGLSPDGTYLMTSAAPQAAGGAGIYDAKGNLISSNMPSGLRVATPAFADDATHVAFNYYSGNASPLNTLSSADGRSLAMMDFAAPKTFSNFRVLYTPPTGVAYSVWPSFLPPGENGVVFQNEVTTNTRDFAGTRSTCDGSGTCNNIGATAELWWVSTGTTPVANKLTNLNGGSYLPRSASTNHGAVTDSATYYEEVYNYEPAVLPVTIGGYSWVAFTSRRLYGNVATINPYWSDPRYQDISVQPTTKKIWIAAISQNPTAGTDPSFPAFYLPGQELLSGNARAYFSLAACESASTVLSSANLCTSNLDCCGATTTPATSVCQLDPPPLANPPTSHCVPLASLACSADGASCSGDAQCCNYGMGSHCASGVCAPSPPLLTYSPAPFVVNFTAACQLDGGVNATYPAWRFFYWQSNTPNGTSITFTAQTSQDGVTYGAPVAIGTAQPPPNVTSTWTAASTTVDQALKASGQTSQTYLRVTATLNPDSTKTITPALTSWQLQYDCEPSE